MSILTDEQIEQLKETHPKKRILRFIFLSVGIFLIITGLVCLLLSVDFGVESGDINLSFAVDILIILFGMILASKYWIARYYLRENSLTIKRMRDLREPVDNFIKFNSFSLSRLFAAQCFIVVGIMTFLVFGMGVGHEMTRYGTAFVLGGPSFFYFTGLFSLVFGLSLLLYVGLSVFRGTFSESQNFYFFYENRPLCPWLTEIPKKDIEAIRYQNNHMGPKYLWIMLLLPFIVMSLQTGIPLFFNNVRQAPDYIFSITITTFAIMVLIGLLILVLFPQNYYEIATKDMLYEMWFSPIKIRSQEELREKFSDYFGCNIDVEKLERELVKDPKTGKEVSKIKKQSLFSEVSSHHFQLFNVVFGSFLIISAIIMLTQMVLFGPLFWWIALMYGFMLLIRALNYDFSRKGADQLVFDEEKKIFKFRRRFGYKFHYLNARKVESIKVRKWFRKLDFFDIFGLGGMLVMLTVQQTEGWAIATVASVITDNVISTIFMAIVFIFIILYLCLPIDVVEFKTPSITYRIDITLKRKEKGLISKYISNFKSFPKEALKGDMKKTFLIRLMMILILIGCSLLYTILNLISYFT